MRLFKGSCYKLREAFIFFSFIIRVKREISEQILPPKIVNKRDYFQNHPFQPLLVFKTNIFINLAKTYIKQRKRGGGRGGDKALITDASIRNKFLFDVHPFFYRRFCSK